MPGEPALHGKDGRVRFNGALLKITEWSGDHSSPSVKANHTEAGGFQVLADTSAIESFNGSFTAMLLEGGVGAVKAGRFAAGEFYAGQKDAADISCDIRISNCQLQNQVNTTDPVMYTCQFESSGEITFS